MTSALPSIRRWRIIGTIRALRKNYLFEYERLFRQFGDTIKFGWPLNFYLAFNPRDVEHVLKSNSKNYTKSWTYGELKPLLGQGLITAEGLPWRKNRRVIAPEFAKTRVTDYRDAIVRITERELERWAREGDHTRRLDVALSALVFQVTAEAFFGSGRAERANEVGRCLEIFMGHFVKRSYALFRLPGRVPTPGRMRADRAIAKLNQIVFDVIDGARRHRGMKVDILSRLMEAHAVADSQAPLSDGQLRDELMTLLMAGHETTANALAWTCFLLAKHRDAQDEVQAELDRKVNGRVPAVADLPALSFSRMCIHEAMRLYPPVPGISRQSIEEDTLGGIGIPAGARVEFSMYVTHRHPDFWARPNKFDPLRFSPARRTEITPFSYFPFGAGPRVCIGEEFAMLEMHLMIAMICQRFTLQLGGESDPIPYPTVTLRPSPGLHVRLRPRGGIVKLTRGGRKALSS